jgi:branched-chain amino acid transport system permease protein
MRALSPRMQRLLRILAYIAFVVLLPYLLQWWLRVTGNENSFPKVANILILAAIGSIAALGLNIIVGYCGLLNLGFAGFMLIGAYTAAILMKEYNWSFWLAALASVAHGALWGIILGIPTLRLTGDYFAIVTFGFSELVIMIAKNWVAVTRGPRGYPGVPRPSIDLTWLNGWKYNFSISDRTAYWWLAAGLMGLAMLVSMRLSSSRLGRAWRALREDEVAAEACGINAMWYKTIAFAISAGIGALAGAAQAGYYGFVDYRYFEFMTSVFVLCYLVLGGMGTVLGPVAGAFVLVGLAEWLRTSPAKVIAPLFDWNQSIAGTLRALPWAPDMRFIIYGIILILMIRFRPEGLIPSRSRRRELRSNVDQDSEKHTSLFTLRQQQ